MTTCVNNFVDPLSLCFLRKSYNRYYQHEAIRRLTEAFEIENRRRALLVMATGTGKTRTAMSLIDVFLRSYQAQTVLFVADRDALVQQAIDEGFKDHIPDEPCTRIYTHNATEVQAGNRLFAVTLQTLNNCFQQFTPAFFDLIVFDEAHRSIFNKYNEVFEYFDGRMVGLTATPAHYIDRNTFRVFDRGDGTPTYYYGYDEAIDDGYLVDFSLYRAQTHFQRSGIAGVDLSEEARNALIEQGIDPDEIDFSGTDLEKKVSNKDTIRRQWEEFMNNCLLDESGQLPGKTIVFSMTQEHALRLQDVFEEMYPQYPGITKVITHKSNYRGQSIRQLKKDDFPRIAISVDMLDTGVNVPEVVNLVFMKPIQSQIKMWQMIGRGTRNDAACDDSRRYLLPNGRKDSFLIIDFWENDFEREAEEAVAQTLPVLVTIFNTRLKLLEQLIDDQQSEEFQSAVRALREQIELIPIDSFSVKKSVHEIEAVFHDSFWYYISADKISLLRLKVGPLLRYAERVDVAKETFTSKVERLKLQVLTGVEVAGTAQSIIEDVSRLPDIVYEDPEQAEVARFALSRGLATASPEQLDRVIELLAPHMKNRRDRVNPFLELDLPDFTEERGYIYLVERNEQVFVEDYRQRVEQHVVDLVRGLPVVEAITEGQEVSDIELIELERTLRHELEQGEVELSADNIKRAYGLRVGSLLAFLRHILDIDAIPDYEDIVQRRFDDYITSHNFNADQIRFLKVVQDVFIQRRRLELADLYEAPLTRFGQEIADQWFTQEEIVQLLAFTNEMVA